MKKEYTFEASLDELEQILHKLEGSDLSLNESLEAYEKAMQLVKVAGEKIEKAEQRVKILTKGADGTITDMPFINDENET